MSEVVRDGGTQEAAASALPGIPTQAGARSKSGEIALIGILAILLMAVFIWLGGVRGSTETPPEQVGSSNSSSPRGTLALYRWLGQTGFNVSRTGGLNSQFPPQADTLIMVNPSSDFPKGQAEDVRRWVEQGHTLVLAMGQLGGDLSALIGDNHPMLHALGVGLNYSGAYTPTLPLAQPLYGSLPVTSVQMPGIFSLSVPLTSTVTLVSAADNSLGRRVPVAAVMHLGSGQAFFVSTDYPFSNQGLGTADNGAFIYDLVASGGKNVAFDENHHGVPPSGGDIVGLLTSTPWGWAILYAVAAGGIYLFWSAKRLGPALPVQTADRRRPTSDYVRAVAALFRRARKPGYAAEQYLRYFRRTLSRQAELDPFLTDKGFVDALSDRGRHPFDEARMVQAIQTLRGLEGTGEGSGAPDAAEADTLRAIRDAEAVRKQALGLRDEGA